jgi:hypothetical protein
MTLQIDFFSSIDWTLVSSVILLIFILMFVVMMLSFRARKSRMLKIFGSQYFTFGIINEAGMLEWANRTTSDFIQKGKVILFKYKGGFYKVMEDYLIWISKIPTSIYRFGNPQPINIRQRPDTEIAVYDEEKKTMVKVKISAQELKEAIESKVVSDLNKFTFNRMEIITIIVMFVAIIFQVFVVYETFTIQSEIGTLINQLNQILSHLPTTTTG